ncbi:MAG: hypothetical protein HUJ68_13245 [Clostridia bacterium]|nr:hypothetical protein [Clostridia bacterium]
MKENVVHLINEKGEKITMSMREYNSNFIRLNESINGGLHHDVDWYLSHGYKKSEDVWNMIENGSNK